MDTYGSCPRVKRSGLKAGSSLHAVPTLRESKAIRHGMHSDKDVFTV